MRAGSSRPAGELLTSGVSRNPAVVAQCHRLECAVVDHARGARCQCAAPELPLTVMAETRDGEVRTLLAEPGDQVEPLVGPGVEIDEHGVDVGDDVADA